MFDASARATERARLWSLSIMFAGVLWLAILAWFMATRYPYPFHGHDIYDVFYFTVLEGRLDLPPRTIRFEGHYAPDGTAYMYHGVAPLLTRFMFGWVWPFETMSLSGPSIWFWAVLGTAGYHSALIGLSQRAEAWKLNRNTVLLLCAGLWFAGPAVFLVSNQSFYHEPIAVAFGATGLFVASWVKMVRGKMHPAAAAILLAFLAALTFHARPSVAVALYASVAVFFGWSLWRYRFTFLLPAILGGALLLSSVVGFMALNDARFGSPTKLDGGFQDSEILHGIVFFGHETPESDRESDRVAAVAAHGRFNVLRILPNLGLYLVDVPPHAFLWPVSKAILESYNKITHPILGYIRVETPRFGLILVWSIWLYLSLLGVQAIRRDPPMAALTICMALSFGLMLSYATVTFRYRIDMWPFICVLAFLGALRLLAHENTGFRRWTIVILIFAGFLSSIAASDEYSRKLRDARHNFFYTPWTYEICTELVQASGLIDADLSRICREPPLGGQ